MDKIEVDVLVAGGGMAGMCAGAYAAQNGASVVLVEKGSEIGGSAVLSGGYLWTAASYELLREFNPEGDPELGRVLIDDFESGVDWVRSTGAWVSPPVDGSLGYGHGYRFDVLDFVQRCRAAIRTAGGLVVTGCRIEALERDAGRVVGATVVDRDGTTSLAAGSTILATGGFQGDPELRRRYIGDAAANMLLRANPHSTGDGLRAAVAAGSATTPVMDGFYGHIVSFPHRRFDPPDYMRLSQLYGYYCLLVNRRGERFVDESVGYHWCAQALVGQPENRALILVDERVYRDYVIPPIAAGSEAIDRIDEAIRDGANVAVADSWSELADMVTPWGYDGQQLVRTVERHNDAMTGTAAAAPSDPPRSRYRYPLAAPPFRAVEVEPAITFAEGGIRIDTRARVLDTTDTPIPGLYAAGADAAGAFVRGYAGGLANAAVFGLRSAREAVSQAAQAR